MSFPELKQLVNYLSIIFMTILLMSTKWVCLWGVFLQTVESY